MNTRSQIKREEGEIMEEDPKINSRSWLKKQRELVAMAEEGGSNVEKQIIDLSTMFQKMSLQF